MPQNNKTPQDRSNSKDRLAAFIFPTADGRNGTQTFGDSWTAATQDPNFPGRPRPAPGSRNEPSYEAFNELFEFAPHSDAFADGTYSHSYANEPENTEDYSDPRREWERQQQAAQDQYPSGRSASHRDEHGHSAHSNAPTFTSPSDPPGFGDTRQGSAESRPSHGEYNTGTTYGIR